MAPHTAVLGAGAWGTALAVHLARTGQAVRLWSHSASQAQSLASQRENQQYLPGVTFPDSLSTTSDLNEAIQSADAVLVVVPSHAFRSVLSEIKSQISLEDRHLAWATKGFEPATCKLLHEVAQDIFSSNHHFTVLSGPTFAAEVAKGLPTAMVSASSSAAEAEFWAHKFHHDAFRMYTQFDMAGVEVGGAYKNIMAIATGVSDGLGLGANARAAIISRGMAEMTRFAQVFGASYETLMGLAGLGDLVLTCTDNLSRNRRFGLQLASSKMSAQQVQEKIGQVVEGVKAVQAVKVLAERHDLDLPIAEQVFQLVSGEITASQAAQNLLSRDSKPEMPSS